MDAIYTPDAIEIGIYIPQAFFKIDMPNQMTAIIQDKYRHVYIVICLNRKEMKLTNSPKSSMKYIFQPTGYTTISISISDSLETGALSLERNYIISTANT